ncbi:MAG: Tm-1-like ATP-binding domain-containing protein [Spirochaetes bacterium]|nr:Tm-1-like ATP-binding domain-containing protein [Spirochaetota bacterium]
MPKKTIVILATLDTKGREASYLKERIKEYSERVIIIDSGVTGVPQAEADISREEVAAEGGTPLKTLLENPTREVAAPVMAQGAENIVRRLLDEKKIHGIVSMGGTQGTTLSTMVMRALPYGFPKVMVSTMASGNVAPWVDIKDITMMFSVTDILGLNPVTRKILANAAGAVCGMAESSVALEQEKKPLVAVTTVGITTQGAMHACRVLEEEGFETIVFHAIGPGGRAMEQLMKEGVITAVLDYATIEVSNEVFGALLAGGKMRLCTAGTLDLPQVICPGAIEVLVYNEPETVPDEFKDRTLIRHSPKITDLRLDKEEMVTVAREIARRLGHTKGEAVFMVPRRGFDSYDVEGEGFFDPEADGAFVEEIKRLLPKNIRVVERDLSIEDPAFAREAALTLAALIKKHERRPSDG